MDVSECYTVPKPAPPVNVHPTMGLVVTRPRGLLWGGRSQCQEGSMDFRTIRYEKLGAVLRITANRPEVLNAQSRVKS